MSTKPERHESEREAALRGRDPEPAWSVAAKVIWAVATVAGAWIIYEYFADQNLAKAGIRYAVLIVLASWMLHKMP